MSSALCRQQRQTKRNLIPVVFLDGPIEPTNGVEPSEIASALVNAVWNGQPRLDMKHLESRFDRRSVNAVRVNVRKPVTCSQQGQ
jgi:hypothetical protein